MWTGQSPKFEKLIVQLPEWYTEDALNKQEVRFKGSCRNVEKEVMAKKVLLRC